MGAVRFKQGKENELKFRGTQFSSCPKFMATMTVWTLSGTTPAFSFSNIRKHILRYTLS